MRCPDMFFFQFVVTIISLTVVFCVNDMSEETCETLPSEIHLTKGKNVSIIQQYYVV